MKRPEDREAARRRLLDETALALPFSPEPVREPEHKTFRDHRDWNYAVTWTIVSTLSVISLIAFSVFRGQFDMVIAACSVISISFAVRFWHIIQEDLRHPLASYHRFKKPERRRRGTY